MPPMTYPIDKFDATRRAAAWWRVAEFSTVDGVEEFFSSDGWTDGGSFKALNKVLTELAAHAQTIKNRLGQPFIAFDRLASEGFVSLLNRPAGTVTVWTFPLDPDPLVCFQRLAVLSQQEKPGYRLRFVPQQDQAFMWRAPLVHPMQVRENAYQHLVLDAGRKAGAVDPIAAQSEALALYFTQDASAPAPMEWTAPAPPLDPSWAAVRMNHLIETFYLFRLLVRYEVESTKPIEDAVRIELSGALTKLLHNGDRQAMGWLSEWLTKKIADLGGRIRRLDATRRSEDGRPRVIFFLKGGRALNYFLKTPEKGENDWDTQVVIDPTLPGPEWYALLSEVHQELLTALQAYNREFAGLVKENAAAFDNYLRRQPAPQRTDDEEIDENEVNDVGSRFGHASCKAELIDIGLPRRDSASALEEWNRLSADGALLTSPEGVIFPNRPYYVNEYLMMVREAFQPNAEVHKARKRVARFALLLASDRGQAHTSPRLQALPKTVAAINALRSRPHEELFQVIVTQFAEAYGLPQDAELAARFDDLASRTIAAPPELPLALETALKDLSPDQRAFAVDAGVAHKLSEKLTAHMRDRSALILKQFKFFDELLSALVTRLQPLLAEFNAQFAITGAYAARLYARQQRALPEGFEPVRRILVQLQCPAGQSEADIMDAVRGPALEVVGASNKKGPIQLDPIPLDPRSDPKHPALSLCWNQQVNFDGQDYRPQVLKIRAAEQPEAILPALVSIDGLPVLDVRYLATDYLRKSAKTDEAGMRKILSDATVATLEMMSQFEIRSGAPADANDGD